MSFAPDAPGYADTPAFDPKTQLNVRDWAATRMLHRSGMPVVVNKILSDEAAAGELAVEPSLLAELRKYLGDKPGSAFITEFQDDETGYTYQRAYLPGSAVVVASLAFMRHRDASRAPRLTGVVTLEVKEDGGIEAARYDDYRVVEKQRGGEG